MRAIVSERSGWDVSSWSVGDMREHQALAEVAGLLASRERPSCAGSAGARGGVRAARWRWCPDGDVVDYSLVFAGAAALGWFSWQRA